MAGAHRHKVGVAALSLQIARGGLDHAGVPLGEQLGVELVGAVDDGGLVIDLGEGLRVPVLPGREHGGEDLLLCLEGLADLRGSGGAGQGALKTGQGGVQIRLLILGGETVEDAALEGVGLHRADSLAGVDGGGVHIEVNGHGVAAGGVVLHGQGGEGGGQSPGLIGVQGVGVHAQGGSGGLYPLIELGADVVGQSGAVLIGLEALKQGDTLLVVQIQLKDNLLGGLNGVPEGLVEGIDVVPVQMYGAQQIQGIIPVGGLPQQALGAGVLPVIDGQNQPVGHDHGLLIGAGALLGQACAVSLDHAQPGQKGLRALLHAGQVISGRLLIQGVHHAAPGGVYHQAHGVCRPGFQLQQGQLAGHYLGHGLQLLHGHRALDVGGVVVVHQTQGVAVGQLAYRPGGGLLGFRRQRGEDQQSSGEQAGQGFFQQVPFHRGMLLSLCGEWCVYVRLRLAMYCLAVRGVRPGCLISQRPAPVRRVSRSMVTPYRAAIFSTRSRNSALFRAR